MIIGIRLICILGLLSTIFLLFINKKQKNETEIIMEIEDRRQQLYEHFNRFWSEVPSPIRVSPIEDNYCRFMTDEYVYWDEDVDIVSRSNLVMTFRQLITPDMMAQYESPVLQVEDKYEMTFDKLRGCGMALIHDILAGAENKDDIKIYTWMITGLRKENDGYRLLAILLELEMIRGLLEKKNVIDFSVPLIEFSKKDYLRDTCSFIKLDIQSYLTEPYELFGTVKEIEKSPKFIRTVKFLDEVAISTENRCCSHLFSDLEQIEAEKNTCGKIYLELILNKFDSLMGVDLYLHSLKKQLAISSEFVKESVNAGNASVF